MTDAVQLLGEEHEPLTDALLAAAGWVRRGASPNWRHVAWPGVALARLRPPHARTGEWNLLWEGRASVVIATCGELAASLVALKAFVRQWKIWGGGRR